jgi:hypothetical protein
MTNIPDRNRAMSDHERRCFLMWLSGFKDNEFGQWLDHWQARQADPAAAAAEVPADLAPIESVDAGTPGQFARALARALDESEDGCVDAEALATALADERNGGAR